MDSGPSPPVTLTNALVLISGRHIPKALSVMSQFIGADRDTLAIEHDCTIRPTYSKSCCCCVHVPVPGHIHRIIRTRERHEAGHGSELVAAHKVPTAIIHDQTIQTEGNKQSFATTKLHAADLSARRRKRMVDMYYHYSSGWPT